MVSAQFSIHSLSREVTHGVFLYKALKFLHPNTTKQKHTTTALS